MNVLLVEDRPVDAKLIGEMLARIPSRQVRWEYVDCLESCLARLKSGAFDIILLDLGLPDSVGLSTLSTVLSQGDVAPVIVLTGEEDEAIALAAVQRGAQDFLSKRNLDSELLWRSIRYAYERDRLEKERQRADSTVRDLVDSLRESEQRFRQLAENIDGCVWMYQVEPWRLLYVSPAFERIWGRPCRELYQDPEFRINAIHPADRQRVSNALRQRAREAKYSEEYRVVRPEGDTRWVWDRGVPIRDSSHNVYRVAGIAQDITERKQLEREVLEISAREQQRISQELHDGVGQELTGLSFLAKSLAQRLVAKSLPEAETAKTVVEGIQRVIGEVRHAVRGLSPVEFDSFGLAAALQQFATGIREQCGIDCQFENKNEVTVSDNNVAMHLFRIAQEATNNAIKHARARHIVISLELDGNNLKLLICDDGVGMARQTMETGGAGLKIMRHRGETIGAELDIQSVPNVGTAICCTLRQLD